MSTQIERRDAEIASFLSAVSETSDFWQSLDVRVIAVRHGERWHNLALRAQLDARTPEAVPRLKALPVTERIGCWQEVYSAKALPELLKGVLAGAWVVNKQTVVFHGVSGAMDSTEAVETPYHDANATIAARIPAASPHIQPQERIAHHLMLKPGVNMMSLTNGVPGGERAINQELRALDQPWEDLLGLSRIVLQLNSGHSRPDLPLLDVFAPLGAAFDRAKGKLESGQVHCEVSTPSREMAARCTVGYIAETSDGGYENGTLDLSTRWRDDDGWRATVSMQLSSDTRRIALLLRIGSHLIDTLELTDKASRIANPRLAAYRIMDPELVSLKRALTLSEAKVRRKEGTSRQFEFAVAQLFALAGLHASALGGYDGVQEAVDVLVHTNDGSLFVPIECTLGSLASLDAKPDRLQMRTADLRNDPALAGADIMPMMVTSRNRQAVQQGDLEFVAHDNLVVLCQEELQEIVRLIETGATASDVVLYCRQKVEKPAYTAERTGLFRR